MPLLAHSTMTLPSIVTTASTGSSSATSSATSTAAVTTNVPSSSMTLTTSTASSSSLSMTMKRKHTLMGCQKFVGAPLTRDQARAKMESSPHFKQLAIESQGWTLSSLFGSSNSSTNSNSNRRSTRMLMTTSTTTCEGGGGAVAGSNHEESMSLELIDRAVALDYGSRLRACLLQTEKVKHSTPY
ncbi:hypothetical protein MHU86_21408 [Fragilaria crotonensis]|nr:hypothetical protein MHU86_21408 [Fragilaria crotonensis]